MGIVSIRKSNDPGSYLTVLTAHIYMDSRRSKSNLEGTGITDKVYWIGMLSPIFFKEYFVGCECKKVINPKSCKEEENDEVDARSHGMNGWLVTVI